MSARGPRNFTTAIKLADGAVAKVHVNRRGCTGRWTKQDQAAIVALTEAVHKMERDRKAALR
jgi:hypothetical protein